MTEFPGTNPYEAPRESVAAQATPGFRAPLEWSVTEAIEYGFRTTFKRPVSIAIAAVVLLAPMVPLLVFEFVWLVPRMSNHPEEMLSTILILYGVMFAMLPLNLYLTLGQLRFTLASARGRNAGFAEVFAPTHYFAFLVAYILFIITTNIGFVLCLVPGFFLMCAWAPFGALICDGRAGVIDSFGQAWRLTAGQRGKLFLFGLLATGVLLAGFVALCIGVLVAIPVVYYAYAFVCLRLSGEEPAALDA